MSRELLAQGLRFHILPSGRVQPQDIALYNGVYAFWHKAWRKTLKELDDVDHLYGDEFTRQTEKTFLTHDGEIIAFFGLNRFDLRLDNEANHSYFQPYPRDVVEFLKKQGSGSTLTMGQLTVDPKWRKSEIGPIVTEALVWQGYQRFLESDIDTLIAFTRNDRKINELCYGYGSRCLREKLIGHNVEIDLIWTTRSDVKPHSDAMIHETAMRLWETRIIHGQPNQAPKLKLVA